MSKTVLVTGATGMVGSQVLAAVLPSAAVAKVISLGRRTTGVTHDKLHEIVHADFLDLSGIKPSLAGVDACFHCLATYQSQVSKEAYAEITCDYQKALTDALAEESPQATFVLFSAQGADPTEKGMTFARVTRKRSRREAFARDGLS